MPHQIIWWVEIFIYEYRTEACAGRRTAITPCRTRQATRRLPGALAFISHCEVNKIISKPCSLLLHAKILHFIQQKLTGLHFNSLNATFAIYIMHKVSILTDNYGIEGVNKEEFCKYTSIFFSELQFFPQFLVYITWYLHGYVFFNSQSLTCTFKALLLKYFSWYDLS